MHLLSSFNKETSYLLKLPMNMTVMMMNKTVFGGDQPRAAGMSVTSSFITDCSATGSTERERGGGV